MHSNTVEFVRQALHVPEAIAGERGRSALGRALAIALSVAVTGLVVAIIAGAFLNGAPLPTT